MKTLPEILTGVVHIEAKENTDCYVDPTCVAVFDKPKVEQAIAKELMGCLPEKKRDSNLDCVYTSHPICEIHRPPLPHEAVNFGDASAYNQALDEVRARLTAFIGEVEK